MGTKLVILRGLVLNLFTVICGVLLAWQPFAGPAIQIRVLAAQEAITSEPNSAHTFEQHLRRQAEVYTFCKRVAGVCVVFARIVWFTHLRPEHVFENMVCCLNYV